MADTEPTTGTSAPPGWDRGAVLRGAIVGLSIIVPVTILRVVLDREVSDLDHSGWIYPVFVLLLAGYSVGGFVAGKVGPDAPLTNGTLAGLGALVLWLPIRIVIWAVREDGRGLFTGHSPVLKPGQLFGQIVIAAAFGMIGGFLGERLMLRRRDGGPARPGSTA